MFGLLLGLVPLLLSPLLLLVALTLQSRTAWLSLLYPVLLGIALICVGPFKALLTRLLVGFNVPGRLVCGPRQHLKVRSQNQGLLLRSLNDLLVTLWFVPLVLALLVGLLRPVISSELCLASQTTPSLTPSPVLQKERCFALPWEFPSQSRNDDFEYHREGSTGFVCARLALPGDTSLPRVSHRRGFAIPVISRVGGVLLAVPLDFLPQEALVSGLNATADTVLGPSMTVEVPAVEEDEAGEEIESEATMAVLLVDFLRDVERGLTEFDPESRTPEIRHFLPDAPDLLPSSSSLLNAALEWSHTEVDTRVHFYSAEEEAPPLEEMPFKKPTPKRSVAPLPALPTSSTTKEVPKPKKVTTAALAEQVASLASSIPALLSQVQQISDQQRRMEEAQNASKIPAYRQPFASPGPADPGGLKAFTAMVGPAPPGRGTPLMNTPKPTTLVEEPQMAPHEEGYPVQGEVAGDVTTALAQQTQAMTALVAHLVGQSDLSDLTSGSSSSALTSKGSVRREKLQNDLAERRSTYLLQVAQLASRRMKPSEPVPASLAELQPQVDLHKVPVQAWRLCRPEGVGLHGLVGCSHRRLFGGRRQQGSPRNHSSDPLCPRSSLSGRNPMGRRILDCFAGGTTSGVVCQPWRRSQSQDEGVLASDPPSLGNYNPLVCTRNGPDCDPPPGGLWRKTKEGGGSRGASPEEKASLSKETERRRRSKLAFSQDFVGQDMVNLPAPQKPAMTTLHLGGEG